MLKEKDEDVKFDSHFEISRTHTINDRDKDIDRDKDKDIDRDKDIDNDKDNGVVWCVSKDTTHI